MSDTVEILPIGMRYAVVHRMSGDRKFVQGELEVCIDSDETAWVSPSPLLHVTDEIINALANELRPLGIKWIRGWGNGGRQGRVITANGPVNVLPYTDVFVDEGD